MAFHEVTEWRLLATTAGISDGQRVCLENASIGRSVRYGDREYGINLVWDERDDLENVAFHRSPGAGPVAFGDRVAIEVSDGGFVRYGEREYGINLVWDNDPQFEWELTGGPRGTAIAAGERVGLFNTVHGDNVLYGERDYGINLRWWSDLGIFRDYPPFPVPNAYRGPSGEPGQIVVGGIATKIEIFHGASDDEADWHIFIQTDEQTRRDLTRHLLAHGRGAQRAHVFPGGYTLPLNEDDLAVLYCEWMVLDGYDNSTWDEKFFSADVTNVLAMRLRSAWDYGAQVAEEQGWKDGATARVDDSDLIGRLVYLQGPFVNDADHGFRVELHPLDSVAYAMDDHGAPLAVGADDEDWPASEVTWRVAAFSNSSTHRINGADYVHKDRTTTWYLPLPSNARRAADVVVETSQPGFTNEALGRGGLDDLRPTNRIYERYRVLDDSWAVEQDPVGRLRLRVNVTMREPTDLWGGMFMTDYHAVVRRRPGRPDLIRPPRDVTREVPQRA